MDPSFHSGNLNRTLVNYDIKLFRLLKWDQSDKLQSGFTDLVLHPTG